MRLLQIRVSEKTVGGSNLHMPVSCIIVQGISHIRATMQLNELYMYIYICTCFTNCHVLHVGCEC